jgi:hypothetical protein
MHIAHVLAPDGRRRTRSATLVRRRMNRRHRPWSRWVACVATGLVCAGALAVLVGRALRFASIGMVDGNRHGLVAGPVDDGPIPLLVRSEPSGARVILDGRDRGLTPLQLHTTPGPQSSESLGVVDGKASRVADQRC